MEGAQWNVLGLTSRHRDYMVGLLNPPKQQLLEEKEDADFMAILVPVG